MLYIYRYDWKFKLFNIILFSVVVGKALRILLVEFKRMSDERRRVAAALAGGGGKRPYRAAAWIPPGKHPPRRSESVHG